MTLRGRLTSAFLVVVLGPVLLGSIFVALTVGAVSRERTAERLDHAATTVSAAVSAFCGQLQAVADAVAVVPVTERSAVADQLIVRGLATAVRVTGPDQKTQAVRGSSREEVLGKGGWPAGWQDCAEPRGGAVTALAAVAYASDVTVMAAQRVDDALLARLGEAGGVTVALSATGPESDKEAIRELAAEPGSPLPLSLTVPASDPTFRYAILLLIVLVTALVAILAARWLARSTTRPLGDLAWAADRVANGDLDTRVPIPRPDELGRLAATFNRMTRELQSYVQALTASRDQLRRHLAILGDTLSSTHDLDRILPVILRTAMTATGARAGLLLLAEPDGLLAARCGAGLTGEWDVTAAELAQRRLIAGRGVLGTVAATGTPLRGTTGGAPDEPACESYLAVPICAPPNPEPEDGPEPGTLGVLALYDRLGGPGFEDTDLMTLRTFAGQAGVAVHNVRVHEEAQRLSLTDPLTGLWNYRYLREVLRREVERASRFGRMLTVLVLDLDHFKDVNDTYGHTAGDLVLGEFARRIRIGLREVDVAFRQGGEEFVVLLPETDAYGGVIVAERLGAAVREWPVPIDPRRPGLDDRVSITVSIGIAVFPEHGNTAQEVLDAADEALYAAKNAGRDTYRLAERGSFDPAAATSGGPQPPRQARGR
ncbi:diguanylate cyclase (GGDEF)-like protein [Actinoplanes lutulentus]|uniref:Diguanylate cyclase (GGDEF)-like protein n=1 Tax=Actinoplanes lutulentus TaxID=1287878 RepID=A0A327ZCK0_9ACTN|nr:diguanylate cyclase [Actinoplanes lutulentus]MBB2945960.1 diguanylate cyclase (GGDEF)-like protein [Actinoplanes lutulentus]RAK38008.1 diguanylate cyclase (GGDEF)-like protein [Actinoplanes lutulentus]